MTADQKKQEETQLPETWTVKKILAWSTDYLKEKGSPSARLDAELLLSEALGCKRIDLYLGFEKPLVQSERDSFKALLVRRGNLEPVAYILGRKEFWGRTFKVSPDVLIPRSDTEILIEEILASTDKEATQEILDIGVGSGNLSIILSLELPNSSVTGWDVSKDAIEVAKHNSSKLGATPSLMLADATTAEAWENCPKYDIIVSNPPYISPSEKDELPRSVCSYEPEIALFAEEDGLIFYQKLAVFMKEAIKPGGKVFFEIGSRQAADVTAIMSKEGWCDIAIRQDYNSLDRVLKAVAPK